MEEKELIDYLVDKNVLSSSSVSITPLTGGVSCQILLIEDSKKRLVLKRALKKLKVKEDWFADVKRNIVEQKYLKYVNTFLPKAVPKLLYCNEEHSFFCMEMLENGLQNWKELLLKKQFNQVFAKSAGEILAEIHSKSFGDKELLKDFDTLDNFHELRIAPYLLTTATKNKLIAPYFEAEAERLAKVKQCLVHGDFSPKNILVSEERLVILDCEVAWYGDPVFDIAFLLNHFVLKALHLFQYSEKIMESASATWNSYYSKMKEIVSNDFEENVIHLLSMLMLARVDGKSPVEYLNNNEQNLTRDFVYTELPNSSKNFEAFKKNWLNTINKK